MEVTNEMNIDSIQNDFRNKKYADLVAKWESNIISDTGYEQEINTYLAIAYFNLTNYSEAIRHADIVIQILELENKNLEESELYFTLKSIKIESLILKNKSIKAFLLSRKLVRRKVQNSSISKYYFKLKAELVSKFVTLLNYLIALITIFLVFLQVMQFSMLIYISLILLVPLLIFMFFKQDFLVKFISRFL